MGDIHFFFGASEIKHCQAIGFKDVISVHKRIFSFLCIPGSQFSPLLQDVF